MKLTDVLFTKKAGQIIPAAFTQELIKHNKTAFGGALLDPKEGVLEIMTQNSGLQIEQMEAFMKDYKDLDMVFWAGQSEGAFNENNIAPFSAIEDNEGKPAIVAFLSGDFSKWAEEKSAHSAAYLAFEKRLKPKLKKLWDSCIKTDGDNAAAKFVEELKDPVFRDDISELWQSHGTVSIACFTGDVVTFMDEDNYKEFDWGASSNHYGYGEAAPKQETKKEETPAKGAFGFRRKPAAEAAPAATPAQPEKPADKPAEQPSTPTATPEAKPTEPKAGEGEGKWVQCPPNINGKQEIKRWYERETGTCPNGYKNKPRVWVPLDPGAAAVVAPAASAPAAGKNDRAPGQEKVIASVEPVKPKAVASGEDALPVLTSKQKTELAAFLEKAKMPKSFVDNNQEIPSQETLDTIEKTLPTFAEQSGGHIKSIRDTFGWSWANLVNMGYQSPEALATLLCDYRMAMFNNMKQNGTIPKKSETAPAAAEEKSSKGAFGFRRKAG